MKLAIFASGTGSNVMAILKAIEEERITAQAVALVCDNPQAKVLEKVKDYQIDCLVSQPKDFPTRIDWENKIVAFLKDREVDLIVLAGFMRIIGQPLLKAYPKRILNIHPSLLPAFPGRHGIRDAFEAGVTETGVTIHFVDQGIDTGEIIAQKSLPLQEDLSIEELESKIHAIEHDLYPKVIQKIIKTIQREEA